VRQLGKLSYTRQLGKLSYTRQLGKLSYTRQLGKLSYQSRPTKAVLLSPRLAAGVEVGGDHDADGFHPTRHFADGVETALGHGLVRDRPSRSRGIAAARFFHAEKLESLVVLVETAGYRREVVATPPPRRTAAGARGIAGARFAIPPGGGLSRGSR
jgi:hypothetical protein